MNRVSTSAFFHLAVLGSLVGAVQQASAQPRILAQPTNATVQLGQDAQFMVTASGVAPLTYQWRFNSVELLKATNRTLAFTNVALNQLGRYEVEVRNNAGTVTSDPAYLLLATRWTELVVFDDSGAMQICTGLAWPDHLANRLGVRLRNYAQGGADTAGIRSQINSYLSTSTPTTNTLIAHWTGAQTRELAVDSVPVEDAVSNRLANVRQLAEAGARSLLLPTYAPPELAPFLVALYPHLTNEVVAEFNARLDEGLNELQSEFPVTIYRPDMFAFSIRLHENPAAYGFRAPAAGSKFLGSDFRCDDRHFSTQAALVFALEFYRALTPRLQIDSVGRTPDGGLRLGWSGGSPPFRIEYTTDLAAGVTAQVHGKKNSRKEAQKAQKGKKSKNDSAVNPHPILVLSFCALCAFSRPFRLTPEQLPAGPWVPVGELTSQSSATVPRDGARAFFRVLHLGQ